MNRENTIEIVSTRPTKVLKNAGYKIHPKGRGWIKYIPGEQNRFHAYVVGDKIFLHYDKYLEGQHPSTYHVGRTLIEARYLAGLSSGTKIEGEEKDKCDRLPLTKIDIDILLSMIKPRPVRIPKGVYKWLIFKVLRAFFRI